MNIIFFYPFHYLFFSFNFISLQTGETNSKESDKVERKVEITTQSGNTSTNSVKTVPNSNKS